MISLAQLRDQSKRLAADYLTSCVFYALAQDITAETETQITELEAQQSEFETGTAQLREDIAALRVEIETLNTVLLDTKHKSPEWRQIHSDYQGLQTQLQARQESLTSLEMQINTTRRRVKELQEQAAKFRSVPVPAPPRGLEKLGSRAW